MWMTSLILALKEIRRHKMRAFLTTLGIIIGVASVVIMVSLGAATTQSVQASVSKLGTNMLTIRTGFGFKAGGGAPPPNFELDDVEAIQKQVGGIRAVAPQASTSATAIFEAKNWSTTITGTTDDYFAASQMEFSNGRSFTDAEVAGGKSVCVIGDTIRENLFDKQDPVGRNLRLKDISCEVIGVLTKRGQSGFGPNPDDQVVLPIKTVMRRLTGNQQVQAIQVAVDERYDSKAISGSISQLLREHRHLGPNVEDNFMIFDSKQLSDTLASTTRMLTGLLAAVAAVSLIVGGIGIMNIMLVSVTERTREIGIRLAIGAVAREVLMQFLVEAITLSCIGGIIGLIFALSVVALLSMALDLPFVFDYQISLLAFFFSALIGVVFGYFPAKRAASLNPIEALRHE
ncbi:MAG: hypothetical protein RLY97_1342 [Pseudomonadota bacterium]|jgi:putative ABC transport system permease protein